MEWTLPLTTCVPWVSGISALGLGDGRKVSSVCGWWPGWGGQPGAGAARRWEPGALDGAVLSELRSPHGSSQDGVTP